MLEINYLEWIGYIGSVIIAVSLTMTSMVKLRWFNLVGALIFTIYGVAIHATPVALVNGFITLIDIYYLYKIYTTKDQCEIVVTSSNDSYTKRFLSFYAKNIKKHFPAFNDQQYNESITLLILRNMAVAGIFIAHKEKNDTLIIDLDFAIPQYQDLKTGNHLFNKETSRFTEMGVKQLQVTPATKSLKNYYRKMGFTATEQTFIKHL